MLFPAIAALTINSQMKQAEILYYKKSSMTVSCCFLNYSATNYSVTILPSVARETF